MSEQNVATIFVYSNLSTDNENWKYQCLNVEFFFYLKQLLFIETNSGEKKNKKQSNATNEKNYLRYVK